MIKKIFIAVLLIMMVAASFVSCKSKNCLADSTVIETVA